MLAKQIFKKIYKIEWLFLRNLKIYLKATVLKMGKIFEQILCKRRYKNSQQAHGKIFDTINHQGNAN